METQNDLFPTDGSETSLKALPYALSLAEENEATLIILQLEPLVFPDLRELRKPGPAKHCALWSLRMQRCGASPNSWCASNFLPKESLSLRKSVRWT